MYSIPGNLKSNASALPNPFYDASTSYMPKTLVEVFDWAEYLWSTHGTYRAALQRVVRYFITDIKIEESDDNAEINKFKSALVKDFQILTNLTNVGDDLVSVGNSFTSLYIPIDRSLQCSACGSTTPLANTEFTFSKFEFSGDCTAKKCLKKGVKFTRIDTNSIDIARFKVIRWSPREIKLSYNKVTGDTIYFWRIPDDVKEAIKSGDPTMLATINWEFVDCVKDDLDFKFNPGAIKHLKETTVTSVKAAGWGIPKALSALKQAWYLQVLRRQNEAIAYDYMLPFRVISPAPGAGSAKDPLLHMNMGSFTNIIQNMLAKHRRDPATYHTSSIPLTYQSLGTEGATMVTPQLIQNATDALLNELGIPSELYYGNLKVVGSPLALRLFERMHSDLASSLNDWLRWLVDQLSAVLSWDEVSCSLRSPTIAEDLDLKNLLLQLQSAGIVSDDTALGIWGIDAKTEFTKVMAEQKEKAEIQLAAQRESAPPEEVQAIMDMNVQQKKEQDLIEAGVVPDPAAQGGAPGGAPAGGGGAPAGGGQPSPSSVSADDQSIYAMDQKATEIAQQLLSMPDSQRRSEMIGLKKSDETLHAIVKSKMEGMRQEASLIGRDQVLAQQAAPQ